MVFQTSYPGVLAFQCPGCGYAHRIRVAGTESQDIWEFNGSFEKPTFTPLLVVEREYGGDNAMFKCVSMISDGMIAFQSDCSHGLAGQTVSLEQRFPIDAFAQKISKREPETEVQCGNDP